MKGYGAKTIAVLRIAALEVLTEERNRAYSEACARWSEKAVIKKFEDLSDKGLIDYGVSARGGWLTDEGHAALAEETLVIL